MRARSWIGSLLLGLPLSALTLAPNVTFGQEGPAPQPSKTPDPVAQARLVDSYVFLLENEDARVRGKALEMLAGMGKAARRVRPAIRTAATDPAPEVRAGALAALSRLGHKDEDLDVIAAGLRDENLYVRGSAAAALGARGPSAGSSAPALAERLYAEGEVFGVKVSVLRALAAMGPAAKVALPTVIRFVGDGKQGQIGREAGVKALGVVGRGHKEALAALRSALRGGELRVAAARALTAWGPAAAPALPELKMALRGDDAMLRWRALQTVTAIGPAAKSARPLLEKALVRPGRDLRLEAARALGAIKDPAAIPALEKRLEETREGHDVLLEVERSLKKLKALRAKQGG